MSRPAKAWTGDLYEKLCALPEGLTGEIIAGSLWTEPRPAGPHLFAETALAGALFPRFSSGQGGRGGWWIVIEPEIHFRLDTEVVVPDLAGWRRERMPSLSQDHRFTTVPDWVCEILSPGTRSKDQELKAPLYARYGVSSLWLIDPQTGRGSPVHRTLPGHSPSGLSTRRPGGWRRSSGRAGRGDRSASSRRRSRFGSSPSTPRSSISERSGYEADHPFPQVRSS